MACALARVCEREKLTVYKNYIKVLKTTILLGGGGARRGVSNKVSKEERDSDVRKG